MRRIIATQPAPEPSGYCCVNCGRFTARLLQERCEACYTYLRKFGKERPKRLWKRVRPPVVWEAAEVTDRCDCGRAARWRVTVPVLERSRTTLFLCEGCAELERALGVGRLEK